MMKNSGIKIALIALISSAFWGGGLHASPDEQLLQLARYALVMEEFEEAEGIIQRGLELANPGELDPWERLRERLEINRQRAYLVALAAAKEARNRGNEDEFVETLTRALRADPNGTEALRLGRGRVP